MTGFDTCARELEPMVACGLSPEAVIHAATGAVGRQDEFGMLCEGSAADLQLVEGNACRAIGSLASVRAVYQQGRLLAA